MPQSMGGVRFIQRLRLGNPATWYQRYLLGFDLVSHAVVRSQKRQMTTGFRFASPGIDQMDEMATRQFGFETLRRLSAYLPSLKVSASWLLMSFMEATSSSHASLAASETLILLRIRTRADCRKTLEYL
jgi:hypothetical protein